MPIISISGWNPLMPKWAPCASGATGFSSTPSTCHLLCSWGLGKRQGGLQRRQKCAQCLSLPNLYGKEIEGLSNPFRPPTFIEGVFLFCFFHVNWRVLLGVLRGIALTLWLFLWGQPCLSFTWVFPASAKTQPLNPSPALSPSGRARLASRRCR